MSTYCQDCGRQRGPRDWACPNCGNGIYGPLVRRKLPALDLVKLRGPLETLPGLGLGTVLVLYGERGTGKSTVALQAFERPWMITTEMEPGLCASYAARLGVDMVTASEVRSVEDLATLTPPEGFTGIVIDSLNGLGFAAVDALWSWLTSTCRAEGVPAVAVAMTTTSDGVRGGEVVPHSCHVLVHCRVTGEGRDLDVQKNRFGGVLTIPWVLAGEELANVYYSVEPTKNGGYQLVAAPWCKSDVWDRVRSKHLPNPPPCPAAAAARWDPDLYGGWVEPPDWKRRAAYSEARGVPYWRPGGEHGDQN